MPELGRALLVDDVDREPVGRGDLARLVGQDLRRDVVGGAVRQPAGDVRALADDPAALGGLRQRRRVPAGRDQHQLVEHRRRRVAVLAVDRLGLEATLDHARARRGRRPAPTSPPSASASGSSQIAIVLTSRLIRRRIAGRATLRTVSRSSSSAWPAETTSTRRAGSSPAARRARSRSACRAARRTPGAHAARRPTDGRARRRRPLNSSSPTTGTTRTSVETSHGWSVTTRICTKESSRWASRPAVPPGRPDEAGSLRRQCTGGRRPPRTRDGLPGQRRAPAAAGAGGRAPTHSVAARLLDRDHGLVEPALGDVGHDHDQRRACPAAAAGGRPARPSNAERTAVGDPPFDVEQRLVQPAERGVVGGVAVDPASSASRRRSCRARSSRSSRAWAIIASDSSSRSQRLRGSAPADPSDAAVAVCCVVPREQAR